MSMTQVIKAAVEDDELIIFAGEPATYFPQEGD